MILLVYPPKRLKGYLMKIKIYSKNNCPHCKEALHSLKSYLDDFEEFVEVLYVDEHPELKDELLSIFDSLGLSRPKTVPQIFKYTEEKELVYLGDNKMIQEKIANKTL